MTEKERRKKISELELLPIDSQFLMYKDEDTIENVKEHIFNSLLKDEKYSEEISKINIIDLKQDIYSRIKENNKVEYYVFKVGSLEYKVFIGNIEAMNRRMYISEFTEEEYEKVIHKPTKLVFFYRDKNIEKQFIQVIHQHFAENIKEMIEYLKEVLEFNFSGKEYIILQKGKRMLTINSLETSEQ